MSPLAKARTINGVLVVVGVPLLVIAYLRGAVWWACVVMALNIVVVVLASESEARRYMRRP